MTTRTTTVDLEVGGPVAAWAFYHWLGDLVGLLGDRLERIEGMVEVDGFAYALRVSGDGDRLTTDWVVGSRRPSRVGHLTLRGARLDPQMALLSVRTCLALSSQDGGHDDA